MVAVVSGSGLGLFGSSASVLGGVHGNASLGRGTDRLYINSATGNLVVQSVDESLAALGLDVSLVRTYNSQGLMDDDNGDNWRLGIHQRVHSWTGTINTAGSTVTKVFGDGREVLYRYDVAQQVYVSGEGAGAHDTISHSGGQWTWKEGTTRTAETYDSNGRLLSTTDADTNIVSYTYSGQLLIRIDDSSGQQTHLDYVGNDLAAIRVVSNGQTQTLTRYYYDNLHRLKQVVVDLTPSDNATALVDSNADGIFETVDDQTYVTNYTYDGTSKRIASITQSDGTHVAFTYEQVEGTFRVKTYSTSAAGASGIGTGEERVTTLNYSGAGMTAEESVLSTTDTVTTTTNYPLNPTQFPPSWSTPLVLDTLGVHVLDPQIVFDAQGNGLAVWAQGNDVYARRYTVATNTWGAAVTLDTGNHPTSAPSLSIDRETGDAIVAWGQYDGVTGRVATSRFTASTGSWSTATEITSWQGGGLSPQQVSTSISGHYAAVAWAQGTSSNRELFQVIYKHGVATEPQILEYNGEPADQIQVQIDSNGNAITVWRQNDLSAHRIYFNRFRDATQAYSEPIILDTLGDGGSWPQIGFDAEGNAFALWGQWNGLQMRRFDVETNSWGTAVALQTTGEDYWNWQLAVDEEGNALVTWAAGSWSSPTLYARRFDAATGEWGTTATLNAGGVNLDEAVSIGLDGSNAVAAWVQSNGAGGWDVYAARMNNGTWSTAQLVDTRSESPRQVRTAIDANGKATVLWVQADLSGRSLFQSRFDNASQSYTVPSGATWQSIANTLYNVNSAAAGEALRLALGNPTLTTGAQLTNLPPTLSVSITQSTTVPAYYTVQPTDTWTSITEAVYGTTDPFVVAELQELLDNPPLLPGMHLEVPQVLNSMRTHVRDALGNVTTYIKNSEGRLFAVIGADVEGVRQRTFYDYDHDGNVITISEDPAGLNQTTTFEYDEHGNVIKTRDAGGNTVTRTYNSNNQVLSETRYRDTDVDGIGPANPQDGLTTRFVYDNENHLRFTISAAGRVTEHRYNGFGQRVSTLTYTSEGYWEQTATENDLESFVSNQPNRERTDYAYDWRGNLDTVTVWSETDWDGTGLGTPSVTRFVYDQRGNLLQTIQPRGELTPETGDYTTTFTYDGLGRLLTTTQFVWNGESRSTLNDYDDADNRIVTTLANGDNTLITTSLYNGAGELINVSASSGTGESFGETQYLYDAAGRLRITIDPVGVRTFIVYDGAGRTIGTVDGDGTLTEFFYNGVGELTKTIQYGDRLDSDGMALLVDGNEPAEYVNIGHLSNSLNNVPGRDPAKDRITRSAFDRAGRLAYTIDEVGAVTGFKYDGAGRVIEQTQYATALQIPRYWDSVQAHDVEVQPDSENDRRTRNFYDKDDKLLGSLDPVGYLVEYKYDIAGRLIEKIGYATATNQALRASGSLDDLRPALDNIRDEDSPTYDSRTRYFYDGRGRLVGELDGEGYLTERIYGDSGANKDLLFMVTRYDKQLTYQDGDTLSDLKHQIVWNVDTGRTTQYRYNGAGDVVKETVQLGNELAYSSTSTEFQYDLAGRVVRIVRGYDSVDARTTSVYYDARGLVRQELTAEGNAKIEEGMDKETAWQLYSVTHTYDNAGRRTSTTNQYGDRTVFYYDDDGRLAYTVNALGEVQHSKYDALGRVIETITYARRIDAQDLSGLDGGRVTSEITSAIYANPTLDSRTTTTYEYVDGRERITTSTAEGTSTTQLTNVFGELASRETVRAGEARKEWFWYDRRGLLGEIHKGDDESEHPYEIHDRDAFGRVVKVMDQYGNRTYTEYDALGRVLATIDPMTARRSFTYDAFSRQVSISGPTPGSTMLFDYDEPNREMTMTSAEGVIVKTKYNQFGQTVLVTTSGTGATTPTWIGYEYDVNGQVTRVFDAEGDVTESAYDRAGRLHQSIDGNDSITQYSYDGANRVLTKTEAVGTLNLVTQYSYYEDGAHERVLRVTQPNGIVTLTRYDRDGRLFTVTTDPAGADRTVTRYAYDDENNWTTIIQGDGTQDARVTRYEFDNLGRRSADVIDPDGLSIRTQYRYDHNGNVTRKIDARLNSTWYVYDKNDRVRFMIDALGGVTETLYDAENRVIGTLRLATTTTAVADWVGSDVDRVVVGENFTPAYDPSRDQYSQTLYDLDGRAVFSINSMGGVTHRTFDANGNVTREVFFDLSLAVTTYTSAEAVGALIATARGVAEFEDVIPSSTDRVSWTTYDARNRAVYSIDGLGGVTKNIYDDADNVTQVISFAERVVGDPLATGALASFETSNGTDSRNRVTSYWYDGTNRPRFMLDAEGWLTETRYLDATREHKAIVYINRPGTNGTPSVPTNASLADLESLVADPELSGPLYNQETITRYDAAGRVASIRDADQKTEYFGYDAVGNRTSYTNKKGSAAGDVAYTWTYEYDAANRLIYERSPAVAVFTVNPTTLQVTETSSSIVTRNEYDLLGNLEHRHEAYGTAQERTTSFEYDALGRQTATLSPTVGIYETAGDTQFGNGVDVTREQHETQTRIVSETAYDVFGNAFRNRVVRLDQRATATNGTFTYKAYDNLGRVRYEIDAKNQVTGYTYDTFGNKTDVTRYAAPLAAAPSPTGTSLMASAVTPSTDSADRSITTTFDRLNREITVRQPSVRYFEPTLNGTAGNYYDAQPTTQYVYNSFGEVIRASTQVNSTEWAHTYSYYDRRGNKVAELDDRGPAKRYLTRFFYDDATGDLTRTIEYARSTTGTVDYNSYGNIVTTTNGDYLAGSAESFEGYDRETTYTYDKLNRKISETRLNREYSSVNGSGALTTAYNGSQTTSYGYDALGNLTKVSDTTGATTFTFYDVLGRSIALAEPARDLGQGTQLIAYTRMLRDAHGNLVQQIEHYNGLAANVFGATPPDAPALPGSPTAHANDRRTTILVDGQGNALRTRHARGADDASAANDPSREDRYASYNIRGDLAKEWQVVVNPNFLVSTSDDITETIVKLYRYDALGQATEVVESQRYNGGNTETVTRVAEYNAFGEIIYKYNSGTAFEQREYYDYDNAGRVWRTNSGDGVDKVFMYDLAGNATLELRSRTMNLNENRTASSLGTYTSAQSVVSTAGDLMRTETVYDAKGNVVQRRLPQFDTDTNFLPVATDIDIGTFSGSPYVYWTQPANSGVPTFWYRVAGSGAAYTELTIQNLSAGIVGANVSGLTGQTYEFRIASGFAGEIIPMLESVGTFQVDGAILNIGAQRADTTLTFTPYFGDVHIVDPPYAVYHIVSTPGGNRWQLGARPASEGGGYYEVQPPTPQDPDGVYNLAANYFYGERLAISIPRPQYSNGIYAVVEFWPSADPSDVDTARVSTPTAAYWVADIEGPNGIANGTYGYRITVRRSGTLTPVGIQEGTFDVGGTNSLTVGSNSSTPPTVATPTTHQKVDRWGNVIQVTDAASNVTDYRYNGFDQLVQTREAEDHVYDKTIDPNSITGSLTRVEKNNRYDLLGRLIEAQDGYDQASRASYNSAGQLLTKRNADYASHANATSSNVYDLLGNLIQTRDELGYLTRYKYDSLGRLAAEWREIEPNAFTDPNDATSTAVNNTDNVQTVSYAYDQAGRRVSETNGAGETTRYRYDLLGNLTQMSTNLGFVTSYVYNADGKKIHETDPLGSTKSWLYDAFGQLSSHTELYNANAHIGTDGGTVINYGYNHAGQISRQWSNTSGQNINYEYDRGGNLFWIDDDVANRLTRYRYDAAGRQARESVVIDNRLHQDTQFGYDNHNRINTLDDPDYRERILYDVNGQRAYVDATYPDHAWQSLHETLRYQYDEMGRITEQVTYSQDQQRNFITNYAYNARGDRVLQTAPGATWRQLSGDNYTDQNTLPARFDEEYHYDGLGRLKLVERNTSHNENGPNDPGIQIRSYTYDLANRQLTETNRTMENGQQVWRNTTSSYDDDGRAVVQTTRRGGVLESEVRYGTGPATLNNGVWSLGYDAANNLRGYEMQAYNSSGNATYTTTFRNSYYLFEGYTDYRQTANSSGSGAPGNGETTRSYNANHELISFTDLHAQVAPTRYFANNQAGQVLTSIQPSQPDIEATWNVAMLRGQVNGAYNSGSARYFFYAQGNFVGQLGQSQQRVDAFQSRFDINATPISDNYPSATPASVIVQAGDTLRTLAERVFGDASLWYILAEENGYTNADAALPAGAQLRVPNDVISLSNTSTSFKPFSVTDALGDTTPTQPAPPAAKGGCGVLGMVLIVVVAIVVTVFTAGVAAGATGSLASIFSTGASALAGTAAGGVGAAIGAAAVGGAVGAAASQGVAIALGMQENFDWKGVAIGAIGAGVTAGLGAAGTAAAAGRQGFAASVGKFMNTFGKAESWTRIAANAAVSSTLTQGLAVATGVQSSFSWRNVAISAVAAPIAAKVASFTPASLGDFGQNFVAGVAGSYVRKAFGGKIDTASILADAFGNAIGNSLVETVQDHGATAAQQRTREELQRDNPSLVGMYDAFIEQGGDPQTFQTLARNGKTLSALTELASLDEAAAKLLDAGTSKEQIWKSRMTDGNGGYLIDINGNKISVAEGDTFGLRTLNAAAGLQEGFRELQETVPLSEIMLAVQVATLGPVGFALDYVKGMAIDSFAGQYIEAGTERLATVLNAGGHHTDTETTAYLLNNRTTFEDLQDAAFNGTEFDTEALAQAENLLALNRDFTRTQSGARLVSEVLMQGTESLKGERRGDSPRYVREDHGVDSTATSNIAEKRGLPQWLKERFDAGNEFNRANRHRYQYNEVEVVDAAGKKYKVDSYDTIKGEIVSRKLTQFAAIKESTGVAYIRELTKKYPAGASISNSPFNARALHGQRLSGDLILEVPKQNYPIPRTVLDEASRRGVLIRDVDGNIYE